MKSESVYKEDRDKSLNRLRNNNDRISKEKKTFINFLLNNIFINSYVYTFILKFFGIKVGSGCKFRSPINFILHGKLCNIEIGDHVIIGKNVTFKIRENGKILIRDKVYIDDNVRLTAAREGRIKIEEGTNIGASTIINSGGIVEIGKFCLISNNCNINSSSHGLKKDSYIIDQEHSHGFINIENDVWMGGFVTVAYNTIIQEGSVIGANSFVTKNIEAFSINVGCPTKKISERE